MLLDVVESMLGHVGHSQVGVLPHSALWGLQLSGEQLDHGRLAGSVGSNDSHAGVEGDSDADALKDLAGCVGVSARQQEDDCEMVRAVRGQEDERGKGEKGGGGGMYRHEQRSFSFSDPGMLHSGNMPCETYQRSC